jgi:dipeptidyl aminopeptidase/acylaminoacyl peptidase
VFVLGHSQGGYMMPRIMVADPKLAGVIVMAGSVRPLEQLIVEQSEYLFRLHGDLTEAEKAQLEQLKRDPWKGVSGIGDSYVADLKNYHPVELARSSRVPMLILQGERDYQVTMTDFNLWKTGLAGRPNTQFRTFPALNHLFVAGEGKSTPAEYEKPAHVDESVIDVIAQWIVNNPLREKH